MDGTCRNAEGDEPTEVLDEYFKCLKFILAKTNNDTTDDVISDSGS